MNRLHAIKYQTLLRFVTHAQHRCTSPIRNDMARARARTNAHTQKEVDQFNLGQRLLLNWFYIYIYI